MKKFNFLVFIVFFTMKYSLATPLLLKKNQALSFAYEFHRASRIDAPLEMFKNRRKLLRKISIDKSTLKNGKYLFVSLGELDSSQEYTFRAFMKVKNEEPSQVNKYFVGSKSTKLKAFNKMKAYNGEKLYDLLFKEKFVFLSGAGQTNKCITPWLQGASPCSKNFLNHYRSINYKKMNELDVYLKRTYEKFKTWGIVFELDKKASEYEYKRSELNQVIGNGNITGNHKYPNFIDYEAMYNAEEKIHESFINIKFVGKSRYVFDFDLEDSENNKINYKLGTYDLFEKKYKIQFKVSVKCGNRKAYGLDKIFTEKEVISDRRIFLDEEIKIKPCPEKKLKVTFFANMKNGELFLLNPIISNFKKRKYPNVLFITADALRYDHTSMANYKRDTTPFIKSLAKNGVSFEKYFVQRGFTYSSLPIMFSGRYPHNFKFLKAYRSRRKSYPTLDLHKILFDHNFDSYSVIDSQTFGKFGIPNRYISHGTFQAMENDYKQLFRSYYFIKNRKKENPYFLWIHLRRPHLPYVPIDKFKKFSKNYKIKSWDHIENVSFLKKRMPTKKEKENLDALYDDNIYSVDQSLMTFFMTLEKDKLLDDTLVVFSSDHGENLGEHGQYYQHGTVSNATTQIPLVIVYPKKISKGIKVKKMAESVDLLPTLLDLLEIPIPEKIDGVSLVPLIKDPKKSIKKYVFSDIGRKIFSIQNERYKLIVNPGETRIVGVNFSIPYSHEKIELYDLKNDAGESKNIFKKEYNITLNLLEKLVPYMNKFGKNDLEINYTQDMLDLLERTGYLHWKNIRKKP